MSSQVQNRLVGSVILIALAVIILPELLDGKPLQEQQQFDSIPLQPDAEVTQLEVEPLADDVFVGVPQLAETLELTAEEATPIDAQGVERPRTLPQQRDLRQPGWLVQLGVFSNQASVANLVTQLRAKGYPAYSESVQSNGRTLHKLLVGPSLSKAELEAELPALKQLTKLDGTLVRFEP